MRRHRIISAPALAQEPIRFVDHQTGETRIESVYGGAGVRVLYGTPIGRLFSNLLATAPFSRFYGWLQDRPSSRRKIAPFIERFDIQMADFLPAPGRSADDPYATFNEFFTRPVAAGARPFVEGNAFPAPCDARYFGYQRLDENVDVPVKGRFFAARALLQNEQWQATFDGGPGFIARLCPVDYHRFHFPDAGRVADRWRIPGVLHSVNPWALAERPDVFMINERAVTILDTGHFGKLAYVEVGATCVGKIVETHAGDTFARGDEKGMFLFGGSTVVVLGEPGRWRLDESIVERTRAGVESYLQMGQELGTKDVS